MHSAERSHLKDLRSEVKPACTYVSAIEIEKDKTTIKEGIRTTRISAALKKVIPGSNVLVIGAGVGGAVFVVAMCFVVISLFCGMAGAYRNHNDDNERMQVRI